VPQLKIELTVRLIFATPKSLNAKISSVCERIAHCVSPSAANLRVEPNQISKAQLSWRVELG
jgi:hypothetical protein